MDEGTVEEHRKAMPIIHAKRTWTANPSGGEVDDRSCRQGRPTLELDSEGRGLFVNSHCPTC